MSSPQRDIVPVCRELGIGIVAYSPLGRGFLTGAITSTDDLEDDDWRKNAQPRFKEEAFKKVRAIPGWSVCRNVVPVGLM